MFPAVRINAPDANEAILTLNDAKTFLRIEDDVLEHDEMILDHIASAVASLDGTSGILNRALVTQTWRQRFGEFSECMRLPLEPLQSIQAVKYFDENDAEQTLATSVYASGSDAFGPFVVLKSGQSWPAVFDRIDPVSVEFIVGYGDAAAVPKDLQQAIKLLVKHAYDDTTGGEYPAAVDALISKYRRVGP